MTKPEPTRTSDTAWVFGASAALTIYAAIVAVRLGLGLSPVSAGFLGVALLLLSRPPVLSPAADGPWAIGALAALFSAQFVGASIVGFGIVLAGFACFAWRLVAVWSARSRDLVAPALVGASLGAWALLFTSSYHPPWYESQLAAGTLSLDVLYHSAVANMLGTYGVSSTGVDGLSHVPYHIGSHWLFAGFADVLRVDVLRAYEFAFPVVCIPLFFASLLRFCGALSTLWPGARAEDAGFIQWLLIAVLLFGVAPPVVGSVLAAGLNAHLLSESYLLGLVAAFEATIWLVGRGDRARIGDAVAAMLLLVWAGFSKISILSVVGPVVLLLVFFGLADRRVHAVAAGAVALCGFVYLAAFHTMSNPEYSGIAWFSFWREYVSLGRGWPALVLFVPHLLITQFWHICATALLFKHDRFASRQTRLILAWLWGMSVLGYLPSVLLYIPGGSAFYFFDISRWFAGAFVLSQLGVWLASRATFRRAALAVMAVICLANIAWTARIAAYSFVEATRPPFPVGEKFITELSGLRAQAPDPRTTAVWVAPSDRVALSDNPQWNALLVPAVSGLAALCNRPTEEVPGTYGFAYVPKRPCVGAPALEPPFTHLLRVEGGVTLEPSP